MVVHRSSITASRSRAPALTEHGRVVQHPPLVARSFTVTGLRKNHYFFRVAALNSVGRGASNSSSNVLAGFGFQSGPSGSPPLTVRTAAAAAVLN